jgi:hypothetical protein
LVLLKNLRSANPAVPFRLRFLIIGLGLTGLAASVSWANAQDNSFSTVRAGDLLFAAVSIDHAPNTWWLVDTGASICELDLDTAKRLQLKRSSKYRLTSHPKNRREQVDLVETPNILVGNRQCGPLVMVAHPLVQALTESPSPVHWSGTFDKTGLLGMNLLAAKHALILWRKQQIYLDPRREQVKSRADYEAAGYTSIPFTVTPSRQIQLEGRLGSNHHQFCLDTGSPKTMIEQAIVDQDRLPAQAAHSVVRSPMNEFPDSKVTQVTGTRFLLGDFELSNRKILAASFQLTKSERGEVWAGLIGADVLWHYDAVIDLGSNTLYLRRKPSDSAPVRDGAR